MIGLALLTVALVVPNWAAGQGAAEDEKLYGTWVIQSVEIMGSRTCPGGAWQGKIVDHERERQTGQGWSLQGGHDEKRRTIDWPKGGGQTQDTMKAIYQVDGDTLKVAFSLKGPDSDRATG